MKAWLREQDGDFVVMEFDNVVDVGEGACGMILIQTSANNILIHVMQGQYLVIEK